MEKVLIDKEKEFEDPFFLWVEKNNLSEVNEEDFDKWQKQATEEEIRQRRFLRWL